MSLPSPQSGWTQPRIETLTALWRSGLSAAQIARTLGGVTRNAVIGKLHRLGLAGRATPRSPRPIRAARSPPRPARARQPLQPALRRPAEAAPRYEDVATESIGAVDLARLPAHACRWPIGDPREPDFGFCGRPVDARPYCDAHRRRAYRPVPEPLDRDPALRRLLAETAR